MSEQIKKAELEELSLEDSFKKIEDLMSDMSDGEMSLEESFEKYKEGMELLKHCSDKIDNVEKQIKILSEADFS